MHLRPLSQIKHLRGKHDQRDHGRRGIGQGSGGVSSAVASITSLTSEQIASTIEESRTNVTQAYNISASTITDPRGRLDRMREALKIRDRNINDDIKQRNALQRTIDRRVKKGGEPASQSERDRIRTLDERILSSATSFEFLREQYNAELKTFQADQRQAAKDRAKAKRNQAKNPIPTPTPTPTLEPTLKPATKYTSESLQNIGLGGWTRFRPNTPPDYSSYDQETPSRPEWMNDPRLQDISIPPWQRPPRNFRSISLTPEGDPVLTVGMKEGETIVDFANRPNLVNKTPEERLSEITSRSYQDATWQAGETVFSKQRSKAEDFWLAKPVPNSKIMIGQAVSRYGNITYETVNGILRRTESPGPNTRREAEDIIRAMDAGMQPAPRTISARRGVRVATFARMQEHLKVGDRFTDDSFTSTSVNPMFNWSYDQSTYPPTPSTMLNIIITEGTPTLWTDSMAMGSAENEVVIGRGVTYEVVSTDNERGWILRTVPPEGDYVPPEIPS